MNRFSIAVIIPTLNEEENIEALLNIFPKQIKSILFKINRKLSTLNTIGR